MLPTRINQFTALVGWLLMLQGFADSIKSHWFVGWIQLNSRRLQADLNELEKIYKLNLEKVFCCLRYSSIKCGLTV